MGATGPITVDLKYICEPINTGKIFGMMSTFIVAGWAPYGTYINASSDIRVTLRFYRANGDTHTYYELELNRWAVWDLFLTSPTDDGIMNHGILRD